MYKFNTYIVQNHVIGFQPTKTLMARLNLRVGGVKVEVDEPDPVEIDEGFLVIDCRIALAKESNG